MAPVDNTQAATSPSASDEIRAPRRPHLLPPNPPSPLPTRPMCFCCPISETPFRLRVPPSVTQAPSSNLIRSSREVQLWLTGEVREPSHVDSLARRRLPRLNGTSTGRRGDHVATSAKHAFVY